MDGSDGDADLGRASSLEDTGKMAAIRRDDIDPEPAGTPNRKVDIGIAVGVVVFAIVAVVALLWPSPKAVNPHAAALRKVPGVHTTTSALPATSTTVVSLTAGSTVPTRVTSAPPPSKSAVASATTATAVKKTHKTTTTLVTTTVATTSTTLATTTTSTTSTTMP